MSGCCCCPDEANERAPLVPKGPDGQPVTQQPRSARKQKNTCNAGDSPLIIPIDCKPVKVSNVDKRLHDHAELFNDHLVRNQNRKDALDSLRRSAGGDTSSVVEVFTQLRNHIGNPESFTIKRKTQYCMQIEYEDREVNPKLREAFVSFNKANCLTKELMDKGPALLKSIDLVVENEREMRRDVLVASLGADGPECMKNCMDNIAQLRKVPAVVEVIRKEVVADFEELKSAVQILLQEGEKLRNSSSSDLRAKSDGEEGAKKRSGGEESAGPRAKGADQADGGNVSEDSRSLGGESKKSQGKEDSDHSRKASTENIAGLTENDVEKPQAENQNPIA